MAVPYQDSSTLEQFVEQVQHRAKMDSYNEAHQACRATVRALGSSISGGQAKQLAQSLPDKLQAELGEQSGQASRFELANFLDKVGGLTHTVDRDEVQTQVSAVLSVLRSWAPDEEIGDTVAQLPPELSALFE